MNLSLGAVLHRKKEMYAFYLLIAVSLLVAVGFLVAFLRSVRNGQFDDTASPAVRILFDDPVTKTNTNSKKEIHHGDSKV